MPLLYATTDLLQCRYWGLNDPLHCMPLLMIKWSLLLHTPQETPNAFQWAGQPSKIAPSQGISTPSNIWWLGPTWVTPQTASRWVHPFLHSTSVDQHTDRQFMLAATPVVTGHTLCTACRQCSLLKSSMTANDSPA